MENCGDIEIKELTRRNPGGVVEVMQSPSTPDAKVDSPLSPLKRKKTPMVDIEKKLETVEERRESYEAEVLNHSAEKQEPEKEVVQEAIEGNCNFSKIMRKKLNRQVEAFHDNCNTWLAALLEKFKEKKTEPEA